MTSVVVVVIVAGVVLWVRHRGAGKPAQSPENVVAQTVTVARAGRGDIPVTLNNLGTVTPLVTVTVRSQVSGYLTQIAFTEGQEVKRGDFLAQVDPRPFQAVLEQYQGNLLRDQALLHNAELDLKRYQGLSKLDSISRQNVDTQAATVAQYRGAVKTDQGLIDAEELNLTYAHIVAPSDGRVGLRQVDVGNYVTPGDANGVVVLTQLRPISVVFTVPQTQLAPVLARLRQPDIAGQGLQVTAFGPDGTTVVGTGRVTIIDNQIDAATGTVKLRALFGNEAETLFPNQFVNTSLLVDTVRDAVVIPNEAVQRGTPGTYVYLVGADNKVSLRKIGIGASAEGRTQVTGGLVEGDTVVVDGTSRLREGSAVTVMSAEAQAAAQRAADSALPGDTKRHGRKGARHGS